MELKMHLNLDVTLLLEVQRKPSHNQLKQQRDVDAVHRLAPNVKRRIIVKFCRRIYMRRKANKKRGFSASNIGLAS
ncbi:hypothetical protein J6590_027272 [Homalodisca vitripennis]|nr:hypothetical protein J6590_027272 [Homalodisca vitripennis]